MLDKIKQAKRMLQADNTYGETKEVTGLSDEVIAALSVYCGNHTPEQVYTKLPRLTTGLKYDEIRRIMRDV